MRYPFKMSKAIGPELKPSLIAGATSIFASPRLIARLGLELQTQQAHTTTYRLDGMSYFEHEQPVDESEVLIVPMTAYDLVLGLPWFKARNPEIDWEAGKLLSPKGAASAEQPRQNETGPDIQTISATAFRDLCSSDEVSHTFSLTLGECIGLLGATTGGAIQVTMSYTPREQTRRAGAVAVVAAEEHRRELE
jgi:hypothetical protein